MVVTGITKSNFQEEIFNCDRPVLIDLWAQWCGPCRIFSPLIDKTAQKYPDIKVCKINIDKEPELGYYFNASSIPMLIFVKDGRIAESCVGVLTEAELCNFIERNR